MTQVKLQLNAATKLKPVPSEPPRLITLQCLILHEYITYNIPVNNITTKYNAFYKTETVDDPLSQIHLEALGVEEASNIFIKNHSITHMKLHFLGLTA